jgi:hypothetical protein
MAVAEQVDSYVEVSFEFSNPIDRVRAFFTQVCCRHAYIRRTSPGRLYLECSICHHTTPGISAAHARDRT